MEIGFAGYRNQNSGQSQAINKGWRQTQGEIITWLNADDLLAPDAVLRAVDALSANPELGGVYGDCTYVSKDGVAVVKYPVQPYNYDLLVCATENFIPQPGTFLLRSVVERAGNLDESLHYVMDYDLWLRIGLYAALSYLPGEMGQARLHTAAKTLRAIRNFSDEFIRMYYKLLSHPNFPRALKQKERDILHQAYIHAASFSFWGGESAGALQMLRQAWSCRFFPTHRTFWLLCIFSVMGKPGLWIAENLHGNPFRLGQDD